MLFLGLLRSLGDISAALWVSISVTDLSATLYLPQIESWKPRLTNVSYQLMYNIEENFLLNSYATKRQVFILSSPSHSDFCVSFLPPSLPLTSPSFLPPSLLPFLPVYSFSLIFWPIHLWIAWGTRNFGEKIHIC